ncbi:MULTISPECIES: thioesterase family protein [unclassified Chelatococcus]|jgi:acyl-CoA thioester hydrolase|uniref:acyl-CoA thioesterase n=1 Tax=unclassified Chelatococcus TaxID=2638111 RepID=UPI001BCC4051|nr:MULTISPECIES: thioesterase family protein [unclassified Chelatococcus]MBS7742941.1 acyl-CoA thioesterase [Chelatococcus sp. HY11]MBX3541941.1 acyl-CoA thioesterase [Chelatococcus sp.]CAH1653136.1 putative 4-hydroxybenzoyl-CoA thioesterase [Hyphomicrobiales bacterium]CAH1694248.1 putative 4-hydroxybenzoyl-CoA thioesterase [Hyphomicrobiales bacterium]
MAKPQTNAPNTGSDRPARGCRQNYVLSRSIPTRWMDNDVYGHVNNVVYYSFFDTAVNAELIERGLLDPASSNVIGLVAETGCRYHAPLSFPENVTAMLRVAHLGRSSVRYEIGLFASNEELAAAEGYFVHVYVDSQSRRPTALPEALRIFLQTLRTERI